MRHLHIIPIVLIFIFSSCDQFVSEGYKKLPSGVYFMLHKFGEDRVTPEEGDLITLNFSYSTADDSAFFNGSKKIRLEDPGFSGSVYECLLRLKTGDSATFIFNTNDFFIKNLRIAVPEYLKNHKNIKLNILFSDLQRSKDFLTEKMQFLEWTSKLKEEGIIDITRFLEEERISITPTPSGLYFILIKVGKGQTPAKGDIVRINYEGRFLNGKFFDSTNNSEEPLEFVFGAEFMVIKGMEEAIGMMHAGDKAMIILPSDLAFGSSGAGDGIIPPYATLIYEIELLSVKKRIITGEFIN